MTDLTDRMRTCAAYLLTLSKEGDPWAIDMVVNDAADLLIEASNALEAIPQPLGEPMEIIEPLPPSAQKPDDFSSDPFPASFTDPGPPTDIVRGERNPRACPKCDSRSAKRVYRNGRRLMLQCPACSTAWQYKFEAKWE